MCACVRAPVWPARRSYSINLRLPLIIVLMWFFPVQAATAIPPEKIRKGLYSMSLWCSRVHSPLCVSGSPDEWTPPFPACISTLYLTCISKCSQILFPFLVARFRQKLQSIDLFMMFVNNKHQGTSGWQKMTTERMTKTFWIYLKKYRKSTRKYNGICGLSRINPVDVNTTVVADKISGLLQWAQCSCLASLDFCTASQSLWNQQSRGMFIQLFNFVEKRQITDMTTNWSHFKWQFWGLGYIREGD